MVDNAGGRSQLSQLTTALIVLIVLLFLTNPLSYMPNALLASVVFLIGVKLVDINGMRTILSQRPVEFWVALITAATVIFVGVEQGIILAIILSIVIHLRHSYRPLDVLVAPAPHGSWKIAPAEEGRASARLHGVPLRRQPPSSFATFSIRFGQSSTATESPS